jgi:hypothetical protein
VNTGAIQALYHYDPSVIGTCTIPVHQFYLIMPSLVFNSATGEGQKLEAEQENRAEHRRI